MNDILKDANSFSVRSVSASVAYSEQFSASFAFLSLSLCSIPSFTWEYLRPHPSFSYFCLFSPPRSAFSKLNSGVNPCSFCPPEKKRGQRGKDSSLFGISIKMKVAPYFYPPQKGQSETRRKGKEQGAQSKGKRRVKAERCRKKGKRMQERDYLRGQRGGLARATLSYIKKMCCALFSLASPFLLLFLSFSLPLSFPLSWPFYPLKRYHGVGGLFYPLLSISPVPAEQKH